MQIKEEIINDIKLEIKNIEENISNEIRESNKKIIDKIISKDIDTINKIESILEILGNEINLKWKGIDDRIISKLEMFESDNDLKFKVLEKNDKEIINRTISSNEILNQLKQDLEIDEKYEVFENNIVSRIQKSIDKLTDGITNDMQECYYKNDKTLTSIKDSLSNISKNIEETVTSEEMKNTKSLIINQIVKELNQYILICLKFIVKDKHIINKEDLLYDYIYYTKRYNKVFKILPDYVTPTSFNEKLQYRKLLDRKEIYTELSDKIKVRDYIESKIGSNYLIPIYHKCNNSDEIPNEIIEKESWVLKMTHGSGMILIKNKNKIRININEGIIESKEELLSQISKWKNINYYYLRREWQYKNIKPRIMIEEYIESQKKEEYQFYCFNGEIKLFQVFTEKGNNNSFYDLELKELPLLKETEKKYKLIKYPKNWKELISVVQILASDFDHVRIDLMNIDEKTIYFMEMTFTSGNGFSNRYGSWDKIIGSYWNLTKGM